VAADGVHYCQSREGEIEKHTRTRAMNKARAVARASAIARISLCTGAAASLEQLLRLSHKLLDQQIDKLCSIDIALVAPKSSFNQDGETKLKGAAKKEWKAQAVRDGVERFKSEHRDSQQSDEPSADSGHEITTTAESTLEELPDEEMLREGEVQLKRGS
jgi:hypothetical protein